MQDDEEEEEEEAKEGATPKSDTEGDNSAPRQRHRVTTKGSNIPAHSETFEDLHDRFQLPSQLMSNLSNNGYLYPTAIQSYGIPILLEVTRLALIASEFLPWLLLVSRSGCHLSNRYGKNRFVSPTHFRVPSSTSGERRFRCRTWCQSGHSCAYAGVSPSDPQ